MAVFSLFSRGHIAPAVVAPQVVADLVRVCEDFEAIDAYGGETVFFHAHKKIAGSYAVSGV